MATQYAYGNSAKGSIIAENVTYATVTEGQTVTEVLGETLMRLTSSRDQLRALLYGANPDQASVASAPSVTGYAMDARSLAIDVSELIEQAINRLGGTL